RSSFPPIVLIPNTEKTEVASSYLHKCSCSDNVLMLLPLHVSGLQHLEVQALPLAVIEDCSRHKIKWNRSVTPTLLQALVLIVVVDIMRVNVDKVLERDQKLSELDDRADALQAGASQFETSAAKLKRKYWWKNCKKSPLRSQRTDRCYQQQRPKPLPSALNTHWQERLGLERTVQRPQWAPWRMESGVLPHAGRSLQPSLVASK
ncbi:Vesicle-associated membrane protein 3, partial [Galemys pyrenaicus]